MKMELSYSQLKSSSEARESEEIRNETRKRSLILLIHSYLNEQGFLNAGMCNLGQSTLVKLFLLKIPLLQRDEVRI